MWKSRYFILIVFLLLAARPAQAQSLGDDYEEILVYLKVQGVGGYEINSVFSYNDNRLFLPVTELFTALRINQETSERYDSITGYLLQENKHYVINYPKRYIAINSDTLRLQENDILKTNFGLYLFTGIFGRAFGLHCSFNFRALSVDLKTDLELPAIRDMRLAQMRKNIEMIRGEVTVDTTIDREYHWLNFGMLDWAINSTQTSGRKTNTRFSTAIGTEALGGETNAILNYSTNSKFEIRNQQFTWRWANNKSKYIRQVKAGKLSPGSIASVYDPFYGVMLTNSPTSYRRSFGEYELTGYTDPGWTVELYINNVLINYKKADASGFYSFDVPLVYGASEVVVKLYGPYGEERIREQPISIPYNFLPKGELEYVIRGGLVDDSLNSAFTRAEASYGVNRFMTLGGGVEYYSLLKNTNEIPFISGSFSPTSNLLITGEYANKVRAQFLGSYRLSSNATFEISWAKFEPGQEVIRFNYLEERKINVSVPVNLLFFKGYTRLGFKQNVYENSNYNTAEFLISSTLGPVSVNLTSNANWTKNSDPFFNTSLSASMRLGRGFTARSSAQIDINEPSVMSYKVEVEKRITRMGYASVNFEDNLVSNTRSVNVAFRYDLPFAQTNVSSRFSNDGVQTTQGLQGSLAFGSGNGYVHTDNRSVTGRGGLTLIPFLDINFNDKKDDNEPVIPNLDLRINGGRYLDREKDSLTRVMDLEPYSSVLIELNNDGFDNIAWQLRDKAIRVYIDPNQFKKVEIPVYPMGEINGMVYIRKGTSLAGQGRILINIFNQKDGLMKKVMSEHDGYFTFLGLPPGEYYAVLDSVQMEKLGWSFKPGRIEFSIQPSEWGDIVDGIDFTITMPDGDSADASQNEKPAKHTQTPAPIIKDKPLIKQENKTPTENITRPETPSQNTPGTFNIEIGKYFVQTASCPTIGIAQRELVKVENITRYGAGIVTVNGNFKVRFGYFKSRGEANSCLIALKNNNVDCFVGISSNTETKPPETLPVEEIILKKAFDEQVGDFYVQTVSCPTMEIAQWELSKVVNISDFSAGIVTDGDKYCVRFGYFKNRAEADVCVNALKNKNVDGFVGNTIASESEPQITQPVEETITKKAFDEKAGDFYVQTASCPTFGIAQRELAKVENITDYSAGIVPVGDKFKIRFGYFKNRAEADACENALKGKNVDGFVGTKDDPENRPLPTPPVEEIITKNAFDEQVGDFYVQTASCPTFGIAQSELAKVENITDYSAGIVPVGDKFKIRFGYFKNRAEADACVNALKNKNVDGFVGTTIASESEPQITQPVEETITKKAFDEKAGDFYVQTASCPTFGIAQRELAKVENITEYSAGIVAVGNKFKIRFGYFKNRAEADAYVSTLRNQNVDGFVGTKSSVPKETVPKPNKPGTDAPVLNVDAGKYFVQTASCLTMSIAERELARVKDLTVFPVGIIDIDGVYKIRFGYFKNRAEASLCLETLKSKNVDAYVGVVNISD